MREHITNKPEFTVGKFKVKVSVDEYGNATGIFTVESVLANAFYTVNTNDKTAVYSDGTVASDADVQKTMFEVADAAKEMYESSNRLSEIGAA